MTHRLTHSDAETRKILGKLFTLFHLLDTTSLDCRKAMSSEIGDYEDAIMVETAIRSKMYEVPVRGKEMVLLDGANGFAEIYYMPVYPRYHCLSEETVFNNDYSVIQELILDKEKIKYVPPVFEVAEVEKDYLICRLDFIESILRRGAKGIKLAELKVE